MDETSRIQILICEINSSPQTIDEYISGFPSDVQRRLQTVRRTIRKACAGGGRSDFLSDSGV